MLDNMEIIEQTGALQYLTEQDLAVLKKSGSRLGSAICFVLRHAPESIGVAMDKQAWVNVSEFIEKFNAGKTGQKMLLNLPMLMEIVRTDNKQRYGLKGEGEHLKIRCRQGHSIPWLEMDYSVERPPVILYHGTIRPYLEKIMKEGLRPMERQKVHLSIDIATAETVAGRRKKDGIPVILHIDTKQMDADGITFYLADNDVWLTDYVAPKYLTIRE